MLGKEVLSRSPNHKEDDQDSIPIISKVCKGLPYASAPNLTANGVKEREEREERGESAGERPVLESLCCAPWVSLLCWARPSDMKLAQSRGCPVVLHASL